MLLRRCPGAEFANTFLYLVISRMLALFKISPQDPLHPPPLEFGLGLVSYASLCPAVKMHMNPYFQVSKKVYLPVQSSIKCSRDFE